MLDLQNLRELPNTHPFGCTFYSSQSSFAFKIQENNVIEL